MARCSCEGRTCNCVVIGGEGVTVTGSGTVANPYEITSIMTNFASVFRVVDSNTLDLTLTGRGAPGDPLTLTGKTSYRVVDLTDIEDGAGPSNGETLVWVGTGTGHFEFAPPPPSPPGAVNVGDGLSGTGAFIDPLEVKVSGEWGVAPLHVYGTDSTQGVPVYVDSNGELRAQPQVSTSWVNITGKPEVFPTTWNMVTGKPASFPPQIGSTATTAKAGNWLPVWGDVQNKPATFPPSPHTHAEYATYAAGYSRRAVHDINSQNVMGLRWNGSYPVIRVDSTEWELWRRTDQLTYDLGLDARLDSIEGSKATAVDDVNQARYARGSFKPHQQAIQGGGPFYPAWVMGPDSDYQFGRNVSALKYKENIRHADIDPKAVLAIGEGLLYDRKPTAGDDGTVMAGTKNNFGLIADQVYEHLPQIVTFMDGEIDGLRYDLLPVAQQSVLIDHEARIAELEALVRDLQGGN